MSNHLSLELYFRSFEDVLKKQYISCCVAVTNESSKAKTSWQVLPKHDLSKKGGTIYEVCCFVSKEYFIDILL